MCYTCMTCMSHMQIIITIYLMFTECVINMKCSLDYMCSPYEIHAITVCDAHTTCLTCNIYIIVCM